MDNKILEKVYRYIDDNRDKIIEDLIAVSSIESVSVEDTDVKPFGIGCKNVLDHMLAKGEREGFKPTNYEYYMGSIRYDLGKEKRLGILAHLDVVPAGAEWTVTEPYKPVIKEGHIFGRGVGDNKSAVIGGLYIMKCFRDLGLPLHNNMELLLGCSEETGMKDAKYYSAHYEAPDFTFVPDAGFPGAAGEFARIRFLLTSRKPLSSDFVDIHAGSAFNIIPNKAFATLSKDSGFDLTQLPEDFDIAETDKGFEITAHGKGSHAAWPESGLNAIHVLTNGLLKLTALKAEDRKILEFVDNINNDYYGSFLGIDNSDEISGTTVSSGTVLKFNDGCISLLNDCRCCVTDNPDRLEEVIRKKADEWGYDLFADNKSYGYALDVDGPVIKSVMKAYRDFTGEAGANVTIGKGGTYAGRLKNAFATGISWSKEPVPKPDFLAPGHGSAQGPDECMNLDNYIRGIKLLATMILAADEVL